MPAQTQKVTLSGQYGTKVREAAAKHAKDPVRYGQARLPGGITNGIARLIECSVGKFEKDTNQKQLDGSSAAGEMYVSLVGTVVEPKVHQQNGSMIPVEGLQTRQFIPICSRGVTHRGRPLSFDDCIAEVQNELRAICGEEFDTADLDKALETAAKVKPLFRFSTTTSKKDGINPATKRPYEERVWENWHGSKGLNGVEAHASNADGVVGENATPSNGHATNDAAGSGTSDDLDTLLAAADVEDDEAPAMEARRKLKELAETAGMPKAEYDAAGWPDVVNWLKTNASNKDGTAGGGDSDEFLPKVGEMYKYSYRDANGKVLKDTKTKKDKKPVQVEVLSVDEAKKTVTLKDMDTGKTIVGGNKRAIAIPFDHLEGD